VQQTLQHRWQGIVASGGRLELELQFYFCPPPSK
jgi:hypothetical protein